MSESSDLWLGIEFADPNPDGNVPLGLVEPAGAVAAAGGQAGDVWITAYGQPIQQILAEWHEGIRPKEADAPIPIDFTRRGAPMRFFPKWTIRPERYQPETTSANPDEEEPGESGITSGPVYELSPESEEDIERPWRTEGLKIRKMRLVSAGAAPERAYAKRILGSIAEPALIERSTPGAAAYPLPARSYVGNSVKDYDPFHDAP